ncbi:prepilin-type N-terminal cleavage/methylation domain-containing protein [Peptococcaceae bacterium]|nr:prepilin-type N-terminal cleavage/methylation domain-containing protein [Peptococcaceae bacterium]
MWNKKFSNQKGFSLIELLVVIAIIGILAAIIAPNVFRAIENSRVAAAMGDYDVVKTAVLQHYADTARFPADANPGEDPNLMTNEDKAPNWNGPYLAYWKVEHPWGGQYD